MLQKVVRRVRGLLGVGLTWGTLWGGIGAGLGFVLGLINPAVWAFDNPVALWGLGMAAYGFVSGIGFGTLLSLGEGSKLLRDLSLKRVPFFEVGTTILDIAGAMGVTAMLGGTFAPGAVAIARRAELAAPDEVGLLDEGM
jgi:hypothetical protein